MKIVFVLICSFLFLNELHAQRFKITEPEFSGNMVYVNDTIGEGISLEKQTCSTKTQGSASLYITGIGKVKSSSLVKGYQSDIRINQHSKLNFIIKVTDNSIDPITLINIFKLEQKKNYRLVELGASGTFSGVTSNDIKFLKFKGKKYGTSSYIIEIDSIEPGEYAITLAERRDLFNMFGINQ